MSLSRMRHIGYNLALALNSLLVMLVLFESRLQVPGWLQAFGRVHPMVLHFPIVLVLLAAALQLPLLRRRFPDRALSEGLLLAACLLAALTALTGLVLSQEPGYDREELSTHKWTGIVVSLLTFGWLSFRTELEQRRWLQGAVALVAVGALIRTGHTGAGITHGSDFLTAYWRDQPVRPAVSPEEALVFDDLVNPILQEKCAGCHNPAKSKGDLLMQTEAQLRQGGKSGPLWDTTESDLGLLMRRVHLPISDKKHMPPKGKPQLSDAEMQTLAAWIRLGAPFDRRVAELPAGHELAVLAGQLLPAASEATYDFAPADAAVLRRLNTPHRSVLPLADGSPALSASLFGASQYNTAQLDELKAVRQQLVSLNLSRLPVSDEDLKILAGFSELRSLNLGFTDITGAGLSHLAGLTKLERLTLSGTKMGAADFTRLKNLRGLRQLYAWQTGIEPADQPRLAKDLSPCRIEWGYRGDSVVMKLNPPVIENGKQILDGPMVLRLKHYLPGVELRYTLDGSDPDSLRSPVFQPGLRMDTAATLKVRAFKPGWISSDVAERMFFSARFRPDSVSLRFAPADAYKANGAATLSDRELGDLNFRSGRWLGFKDQPMEAWLFFGKPVSPSKLSLRCLVDIASYIMPPQRLELWGGRNRQDLKLLATLTPPQPASETGAYLQGYELRLPDGQWQWLRLVAIPVGRLPAWHRGKGDRGWVFADEVFVQ